MEDEYLAAAKAIKAEWSDAFEKRDLDRLVALYAPQTAFWGSTNDLHTDLEGVRSYFLDLIAVGTPITERPPHRSERAQFGHSAPTLGA